MVLGRSENEVKTFSEAMNMTQRFIQAVTICCHSDNGSKKKKEKGKQKDQPKQQKTGGGSNRFSDHGYEPRFSKNRREMYLDIKDKFMLPCPPPSGVSTTKSVDTPSRTVENSRSPLII